MKLYGKRDFAKLQFSRGFIRRITRDNCSLAASPFSGARPRDLDQRPARPDPPVEVLQHPVERKPPDKPRHHVVDLARATISRLNRRCLTASHGSLISSRKRCGRKPVVMKRLMASSRRCSQLGSLTPAIRPAAIG